MICPKAFTYVLSLLISYAAYCFVFFANTPSPHHIAEQTVVEASATLMEIMLPMYVLKHLHAFCSFVLHSRLAPDPSYRSFYAVGLEFVSLSLFGFE